MNPRPHVTVDRRASWWRDPDVLLPILLVVTLMSVAGVATVLVTLIRSIDTDAARQQVVVDDLAQLQRCTVELLLVPHDQRTADLAEELCPPLPGLDGLPTTPAAEPTPEPTAVPTGVTPDRPAAPAPERPAAAPPPPPAPPEPAAPGPAAPPPAAPPPAPPPAPPAPDPGPSGPVGNTLDAVCGLLPVC